MKQKFFALFAVAALLLGMSACSTVDNPSSGGGSAQEDPVVAPAQLKQGIWTEFDEALLTSGKYTVEQLAQMPTVGMWIQGDKGYFFTYTAEEASETVEGNISYNNKTGKGTITFPAIQDSPLSGQSVSFSMTTDETMEFEFTYEGQKTTGTCAWLCENLDDWTSDITDEDWKELMSYYETISAESGPDATIDWSSSEVADLDKPLVWNEEVPAATRALTRFADPFTLVSMGSDILGTLFEMDEKLDDIAETLEEMNAKLDVIMGKLDLVLENQQKMMQQLSQINDRLKAIANLLKQQETVKIFNDRNEKFYDPLDVQNGKYFNDAYKLYNDNKSDLSKVSATLGDYAKLWAGKTDEKYIDLTWQYIKYLTTVQHTTYGTGMDRIYDGMTFEKYPWEHMGIGDRQYYRAYDLTMISKCLFMITLYTRYCLDDKIAKRGIYNIYASYKPKLQAFNKFEVPNPAKFLVCQIPGAHFMMHKELQKYNYLGANSKAPHPNLYGSDAVYRPEWHEAGSVKIENPAEMKSKLIRVKEVRTIHDYYKAAFFPNEDDFEWTKMLVEYKKDGKEVSAGADYSKKPTGDHTFLLLFNHESTRNGVSVVDNYNSLGISPVVSKSWKATENFDPLMVDYYMGTIPNPATEALRPDLKGKWIEYNTGLEYYAAIVAERY